jgi:predicted DNA-binding transcriptional regulator AlpA
MKETKQKSQLMSIEKKHYPKQNHSKIYKTEDIMRMFGIGRSTVWKWVKNGTLPAPAKLGKLNVWKLEQIEDFIAKLGTV